MLTVERLLQFMRELRTDLPEPERESLGTACREMLLNAVEHGGGFDADQAVEVHRVKTARFVLYAIRDPGEGFSFDALPQAAVSNPDDPPLQHAEYRERHGLRPGGLGLLVSRGLVDELIHSAATKCC